MAPESLVAADPPDMVSDAVNVGVVSGHRAAHNFLAQLDCFHHGAVALAPPANVVHLATPGRRKKRVERSYQIGAMDVVADLFAPIPVHGIRLASYGAFHQIGQKTVQSRTRVVWAGETATAKAGCPHPEVPSILLNENVGSHL